jgi:hypothetical protein
VPDQRGLARADLTDDDDLEQRQEQVSLIFSGATEAACCPKDVTKVSLIFNGAISGCALY